MIEKLRRGELARLPLLEAPDHDNCDLAAPPGTATPATTEPHGPLAAAQARWLNEMFKGLLSAVELALRLQLLVADAKFADYASFCEIYVNIIDTMTLFTAASSAAFTERAAWMEQALAAAARASPASDDDGAASPPSAQALSSDGSANAGIAALPKRMLLFRMPSQCNGGGCPGPGMGDEVASQLNF